MRSIVAWRPVGDQSMASSRMRAFLPCEYLRKSGYPCEIFDAKNLGGYKIVVIQKDYYKKESVDFVRHLKDNGIKVIVDICDNDFYNPHGYPEPECIADRLSRIVKISDCVTVSTPELEKTVSDCKVVVIDDFIDYRSSGAFFNFRFPSSFKSRSLRLVWYGNNRIEPRSGIQSGIVDLQEIIVDLEELHQDLPISLTVISNDRSLFDQYVSSALFPTQFSEWKYSSFERKFKDNDVCILPISVNPFSICKTNNRVVLSLLMGLPVVADKIPSYEEFNEFILFANWKESLRQYALDPKLRKAHVEAARKHILEKYKPEKIVSQWQMLFDELLDD
jgi:hypothetical protein